MGVIGHAIGRLCFHDGGDHLVPGAGDVQIDRLRRLEQAVDVFVKEGPLAVVKADAFPHAIAQHEAGIVDRDDRLRLGLQLPVHPDQDVFVAGVFFRLMGRNMVSHSRAFPLPGHAKAAGRIGQGGMTVAGSRRGIAAVDHAA